jgi:AbrB family looped-hinge helix DNA binding protein
MTGISEVAQVVFVRKRLVEIEYLRMTLAYAHIDACVAIGSCGRIFLPIMATHNSTLEYLATTKIGEKGQLTVPKQFRQELGLGTGAPFAVLRLGDGLILLPEQQRFEHLCQEVSTSLTATGLTSEDLLATLPEARNRVYARRYSKKPTGSVSRHHSRSHRER